jgi:hypothetical protein
MIAIAKLSQYILILMYRERDKYRRNRGLGDVI